MPSQTVIRLTCEPASRRLELGGVLRVHLETAEAVETLCHLTHPPIVYLRPIGGGWQRRRALVLYPEAPGAYRLSVAWRDAAGSSGVESVEFRVLVPASGASTAPGTARIGEDLELTGPHEWEVRLMAESEGPALDALAELVAEGSVVYDVGANLGLYALRMARLAGPRGRVVCFEANPVCVSYLATNVKRNRLEQVEIVPVALLDREGETAFTVNYGNSNLGTAGESGFFGDKTGHEIRVACAPLDALVGRLALPDPDLIKIDVEGAEHLVVRGMAELVARARPDLLLELHGRACAEATFAELDAHGYRYQVAGDDGEPESGEGLLRKHGDRVLQVVARTAAKAEAPAGAAVETSGGGSTA
jgi:FkbM family methyltransferase